MIRWMVAWVLLSGGFRFDFTELQELVAKGDWGRAHHSATDLERQLAKKAPLEVLDGQLLAGPAAGLGIYEPAANAQIRGEDIYLYAHVRNQVSRKSARGYELFLETDLLVLDRKGEVLAEDRGFGVSRFHSRSEHRDTFVNIGVKSKGLPPGDYIFRLIIHDRFGGKEGSVEIPVVMPMPQLEGG